MIWKVGNEIVDPKQLFSDILYRSKLPIGVVVFDAEGSLRNEIRQECAERLPSLGALGNRSKGVRTVSEAGEIIKRGGNALLVMDGLSSAHHDSRHNAITSLRNYGAKTIVGIFAEQDDIITARTDNDPPNGDGLEHFIKVKP